MIRYKYDKVRASCVAKVCQELRTMDLVCAVPVVGTPYSGIPTGMYQSTLNR